MDGELGLEKRSRSRKAAGSGRKLAAVRNVLVLLVLAPFALLFVRTRMRGVQHLVRRSNHWLVTLSSFRSARRAAPSRASGSCTHQQMQQPKPRANALIKPPPLVGLVYTPFSSTLLKRRKRRRASVWAVRRTGPPDGMDRGSHRGV
jgi:hypothetical protein